MVAVGFLHEPSPKSPEAMERLKASSKGPRTCWGSDPCEEVGCKDGLGTRLVIETWTFSTDMCSFYVLLYVLHSSPDPPDAIGAVVVSDASKHMFK